MKIIGINGSPHRNGNSATLMRAVLEGAKSCGAQVDEIHLVDYKIEYCKGCMSCKKVGKCIINDDLSLLKEKLIESDGIVLASPTYGSQPTARMKNFLIDRLGIYTKFTSEFRGKYFIGLSTAGSMGAKKTANHLANTFSVGFWEKAYVTGTLGVSVTKNFESHNVSDQQLLLKKAHSLGQKIVSDCKNNKTYPLQNILKNFMSQKFISKFIKKEIVANKDGSYKAIYDRLVETGDI